MIVVLATTIWIAHYLVSHLLNNYSLLSNLYIGQSLIAYIATIELAELEILDESMQQ